MLSRRKFFSSLPAAALALTSTAKAEDEPKESPVPWVELTCQRPEIGSFPACGQRFKVLRGTNPYCPKCGALQNTGVPELREKFVGIPC